MFLIPSGVIGAQKYILSLLRRLAELRAEL